MRVSAHNGSAQVSGIAGNALYPALYMAFMFALPPKALGTQLYAGLLVGASLVYFLAYTEQIIRQARHWAYLSIALLVALQVLISYLNISGVEGRLFDADKIITQSAGMMIFLIVMPNFMHAASAVFLPGIAASRAMLIAVSISASIILWQQNENIFADYGLYGAQSAGLMLQLLYFLLVLRAPNPVAQALLLLAAMPLLNAGTNIVIQLALVLLVLSRHYSLAIGLLGALMAVITFVIAYPPDWVAALLASDPNAMVRSQMWRNALATIAERPLGIGYGTAWSNEQALKEAALMNAYSRDSDRALEVANHSSFVDITLRLGWLGLGLFIALIASFWRSAAQSPWSLPAAGILTIALVAATLNPMLESGRAALIMAFALAYLRAAGLGSTPLPDQEVIGDAAARGGQNATLSPRERRKQLAMLDHG